MITFEMKDKLVRGIIEMPGGSRPLSLSDVLAETDGIEMEQAIKIVRELEARGLVRNVVPVSYPEDLRFRVDSQLDGFAQNGGFEAEYIVNSAKLKQCVADLKELVAKENPTFKDKIMPILEVVDKLANIGANAVGIIGAL